MGVSAELLPTIELVEPVVLVERCERLCLELLRTDIGLAYAFLRLAETEIETEFGDVQYVSKLVEKAKAAHDCVRRHLRSAPLRVRAEKHEVERGLGELAAAIDEAEKDLQRRLISHLETSRVG
jgi:hypothetical protein